MDLSWLAVSEMFPDTTLRGAGIVSIAVGCVALNLLGGKRWRNAAGLALGACAFTALLAVTCGFFWNAAVSFARGVQAVASAAE
ncbi:MAG: hypothetical protein IT406_01300 [Candidatus Yanofskybacteria bacterium]|nr:hypothetical protein [Candidatus Yanofskybacteria bacterium]